MVDEKVRAVKALRDAGYSADIESSVVMVYYKGGAENNPIVPVAELLENIGYNSSFGVKPAGKGKEIVQEVIVSEDIEELEEE